MHFQHSPDMWAEFPELRAGVLRVTGIDPGGSVRDRVEHYGAVAEQRLAGGTESDLPEIQAWRRAFSRMGLKPTQYRCASESLLRRFRKERSLPAIHPLVDLCNAVSLAYAIPIAVFDLANVAGHLEVRHAAGDEAYLTFSGETEHPEPREVVFVDARNRAHARRWTNRQSGLSAVRDTTASALIVVEALHPTADTDVPKLLDDLAAEVTRAWSGDPAHAVLSSTSPRFTF
ncbi:B3/4 domain-containing protein [Actinosynnema sp. NPDC059335]|uniref:B3/B4 domain-containing protein n=1 Tax=Actinosynnema sp. NPDC059335 TaxID=3346804 RepID=UPI003670A8CF